MSKPKQTYKQLLSTVKECIRVAQVKTVVAANSQALAVLAVG